jgi:hypothetical protein
MSDMGFTPNLIASGTIAPFRLVTISGAFQGAASNAIADYAVGVTDGSVNAYNGANHAVAAGTITLQPSNTVQVEVGTGGCTVGDFLMCVASSGGTVTVAAGVTAKSSYIALETGAAGDIIRAFRFGYRGPVFA